LKAGFDRDDHHDGGPGDDYDRGRRHDDHDHSSHHPRRLRAEF